MKGGGKKICVMKILYGKLYPVALQEQLLGSRVSSTGWARLACLQKAGGHCTEAPGWPRAVGESWGGGSGGKLGVQPEVSEQHRVSGQRQSGN